MKIGQSPGDKKSACWSGTVSFVAPAGIVDVVYDLTVGLLFRSCTEASITIWGMLGVDHLQNTVEIFRYRTTLNAIVDSMEGI